MSEWALPNQCRIGMQKDSSVWSRWLNVNDRFIMWFSLCRVSVDNLKREFGMRRGFVFRLLLWCTDHGRTIHRNACPMSFTISLDIFQPSLHSETQYSLAPSFSPFSPFCITSYQVIQCPFYCTVFPSHPGPAPTSFPRTNQLPHPL